jgi:hypothetical protein
MSQFTTNTNTDKQLVIGNHYDLAAASEFAGLIDHAFINPYSTLGGLNAQMTDDELLSCYNSLAGKNYPKAAYLYLMDETSGTVVNDTGSLGAGKDLTNTNATITDH